MNSRALTSMSSKQQRDPTYLELLSLCPFKSFVTHIKRLHVLAWGLCTDFLHSRIIIPTNGENPSNVDPIWSDGGFCLIVPPCVLQLGPLQTFAHRYCTAQGLKYSYTVISVISNFMSSSHGRYCEKSCQNVLHENEQDTYFSPQVVPLLVCSPGQQLALPDLFPPLLDLLCLQGLPLLELPLLVRNPSLAELFRQEELFLLRLLAFRVASASWLLATTLLRMSWISNKWELNI